MPSVDPPAALGDDEGIDVQFTDLHPAPGPPSSSALPELSPDGSVIEGLPVALGMESVEGAPLDDDALPSIAAPPPARAGRAGAVLARLRHRRAAGRTDPPQARRRPLGRRRLSPLGAPSAPPSAAEPFALQERHRLRDAVLIAQLQHQARRGVDLRQRARWHLGRARVAEPAFPDVLPSLIAPDRSALLQGDPERTARGDRRRERERRAFQESLGRIARVGVQRVARARARLVRAVAQRDTGHECRRGDAEREAFTQVLQGMIAIHRARFPLGRTGRDIDALARAPLWAAGRDYAHGTGHGVGVYLGVHEGPQRIAHISQVPLKPGMILSNEPGYYREGAFGIRIENLIVVREAPDLPGGDDRAMLDFETLTFAPIDRRLIVKEMLSEVETSWLNAYHSDVARKIGPLLEGEAAVWLQAATAPL